MTTQKKEITKKSVRTVKKIQKPEVTEDDDYIGNKISQEEIEADNTPPTKHNNHNVNNNDIKINVDHAHITDAIIVCIAAEGDL